MSMKQQRNQFWKLSLILKMRSMNRFQESCEPGQNCDWVAGGQYVDIG